MVEPLPSKQVVASSSLVYRSIGRITECRTVVKFTDNQNSKTVYLASNKIVWRNVEAKDRVNFGAFAEFNLGFNAIHKLTR